jgi:hypothetical protein
MLEFIFNCVYNNSMYALKHNRIGLICKPDKGGASIGLERIAHILEKHNIGLASSPKYISNPSVEFSDIEENDIDFVVAVGGDGHNAYGFEVRKRKRRSPAWNKYGACGLLERNRN